MDINSHSQQRNRHGMQRKDSLSRRDAISAESQEERRKRIMVVETNKCPLYEAGNTYFLSHRSGMPAKIYIEAVYKKAGSKEWMYSIISEANGGKSVYVSESVLKSRIAKHTSKVYSMPEVAKRIEEGYRFCGNYPIEDAFARGKELADVHKSLESVMLYSAYDSAGNSLADKDMYGIWVKWNYVIMDSKVMNGSPIRIK